MATQKPKRLIIYRWSCEEDKLIGSDLLFQTSNLQMIQPINQLRLKLQKQTLGEDE